MIAAYSHGQVKGVVLDLLLVALCALAVYAICRFIAGRPDIGGWAAAIVGALGVILVLLDNL
jgi:hypothetical protein